MQSRPSGGGCQSYCPGCQPLLATIANGKMLVRSPKHRRLLARLKRLHRHGLSMRRIATKVTTEGIKALQKALPNSRIVHESIPGTVQN